MKLKLTVAFLLSLTSSLANAEFDSHKPIICDDTRSIMKSLTEVYNEKLLWSSPNFFDHTTYGLFVNSHTGSWTLVQMNMEIACILGVGEEYKLNLENSI